MTRTLEDTLFSLECFRSCILEQVWPLLKATVGSYSAYLTREELENCSASPAFSVRGVGPSSWPSPMPDPMRKYLWCIGFFLLFNLG